MDRPEDCKWSSASARLSGRDDRLVKTALLLDKSIGWRGLNETFFHQVSDDLFVIGSLYRAFDKVFELAFAESNLFYYAVDCALPQSMSTLWNGNAKESLSIKDIPRGSLFPRSELQLELVESLINLSFCEIKARHEFLSSC